MRFFTAVIHKDEGSAYGVSFPDLPGAFAAADSWDDIPRAVAEALDLWFEDMPEVEPAPIDAIRQRDDVQAALAEGASLMGFHIFPPTRHPNG